MKDNMILLHSERLLFRQIEDTDFETIARIMRDEGVQKVWEHYFTDEDVRAWIERRQNAYRNNGIDYLLAIDKQTNKPVGQIGLLKENIEGNEVWGIGYILLSEYCGNGYATEGAKAMAKYAFETLQVPKLVCDIRPMNKASIAVAKRLGMVETGSFVKIYQGMEMPHLIFELVNKNVSKKIDLESEKAYRETTDRLLRYLYLFALIRVVYVPHPTMRKRQL